MMRCSGRADDNEKYFFPSSSHHSGVVQLMVATSHLYLASRSPRRRELLTQIGVNHSVLQVDVPEMPLAGERPAEYVQRLAREKSLAGVTVMQALDLPERPVLGADTIVVSDGAILEKPRDKAQAHAMLKQLSGCTHEVMTAVALSDHQQSESRLSVTEVQFRVLTDEEISAYWDSGEPCDKAGAYAIQGLGAVFVSSLRGSYSGVVGLPIDMTVELMQIFGVPWWQPVKDQPDE